MKAEMKGVGSRWIVVRSDNVLNLDTVSLPVVALSSSICAVEELRKRVGASVWTTVVGSHRVLWQLPKTIHHSISLPIYDTGGSWFYSFT